MKLTAKLILLSLLLTTVPLGIVGYLAYDNGRRTIEQDTVNHLTSITILKEAQLERWVEDSKQRLRELARRPLIREYAALLASHDPSTGSGRGPADPAYWAAHKSIVEDHLTPTLEEERGVLELFLLRAGDGLILVSTDEKQEGKYKESDPYLVEGKKGTYVKNVYYSLTLGEAAMVVATPVADREGNLVAVLAARVDLGEISEIMRQGRVLSASEETYVVNKFNFFVTESRFAPDYALKKALHTEGVQTCLEHKDGVGFYDGYRAVPVIGAYRWMPERELCILTEVDQFEAFAPIVALRDAVLGTAVAVAFIVMVLAVLFARTITGPVHQLVKGAEEFGRGNLAYRIEAGGSDEIGQLSRAFDQMAKDLQAITASRDELNREITERKQAEEQLKAALAEKEVLLREIHHRVKNNLQAIISLIDLQVKYIADPQLLQMLGELQERARTMALVHEQLVGSQDLARIDFGAYLQDLTANLWYTLGADPDIALRVNAAHVFMSVDQATPCGLIVNELVTNALKYAFSQDLTGLGKPVRSGCEIRVEFGLHEDEYVLLVGDNGVGLPPELDWRTARSLGLRLVNLWARHQLGGSIELDDQRGTVFRITFRDRKRRS